MKITLFTANQSRHNYLVNLLSSLANEIFVVQENKIASPSLMTDLYPSSKTMEQYFNNVSKAQNSIFGNCNINSENIKLLTLENGDLSKCSLDSLSNFLKSDIYIVFGSSYIKGDLADFLVRNKALNIHMGLAPYYRGADCNFWALYDNNPQLVGATIHMLSKGLDSGDILYHALPEQKKDIFEYTMSSVQSAFYSLAEKIKDQSIFKIQPEKQDKSKEIRYSKKQDFTEEIVKEFFAKKVKLSSPNFNEELYKDPFRFNFL